MLNASENKIAHGIITDKVHGICVQFTDGWMFPIRPNVIVQPGDVITLHYTWYPQYNEYLGPITAVHINGGTENVRNGSYPTRKVI